MSEERRYTEDDYTYRLFWSDEDGEYVAVVEEFPHLSSIEPSPTKALDGIIMLVGDVLEDIYRDGEVPPGPAHRAEPVNGGDMAEPHDRATCARLGIDYDEAVALADRVEAGDLSGFDFSKAEGRDPETGKWAHRDTAARQTGAVGGAGDISRGPAEPAVREGGDGGGKWQEAGNPLLDVDWSSVPKVSATRGTLPADYDDDSDDDGLYEPLLDL